MVEYAKPWLSLKQQIETLKLRGVEIGSEEEATTVLRQVGYYRLTGYLYPFRDSEPYRDDNGRERTRVLNDYRPGTSIADATRLIDYDRGLRLLVIEAVDRIEVSLRMQVGHRLGHLGAFAHRDPVNFTSSFTEIRAHRGENSPIVSRWTTWLERVHGRQAESDEAFVAHFRQKYDDNLPIWALTEILELGQLSRLYAGLDRVLATEIANAYGVPTKRVFGSWIASVNYVRNVSAHHARLFNRKLVQAPALPTAGQIPPLDHLRHSTSAKARFGVYNALAIMAHLVRTIDPKCDWNHRIATHLASFPSGTLTTADLGAPIDWMSLNLWGGN